MGRNNKTTAVVVAAGQGKRMGSDVHKQYLLLEGKPVLYYPLQVLQKNSLVDEVVLVVGNGEIDYCQEEIINQYQFNKVIIVTEGGKERCDSVYAGLLAASGSEIVLIHDGARPFLTDEIIARSVEAARQYGACVAAMPVKDTIKEANDSGFAAVTHPREKLWLVQTPQSFSYDLIKNAYETYFALSEAPPVTDDAMVVEQMLKRQVKIIEGSYLNIKVTTPEDMIIAKAFLTMKAAK